MEFHTSVQLYECGKLIMYSHEKRPRENEGTERDTQGVDWDISIPLKLFLVLGGNGSLFPQTSA